jgi:hypothetical protein
LNSEICSCENILKESKEAEEKCAKKCPDGEQMLSCGGDETENIYETGSNSPGPVRNLKIQETTDDRITIEFDSPERNGTELSGYEIKAFVIKTYSNNPWHNQTWNVEATQNKFDLSNLLSSTKYNISVKAKNVDLEGGEKNIEATTRLKVPDPNPEAPKIISLSERTAKIEIKSYKNNNGPVSKIVIVVSLVESDFVKSEFDTNLLTNYQKAMEDGLNFWITGEIDPFQEEKRSFTIGDGLNYGKYFNAPLKTTKNLHVLVSRNQ